MCVLQCVVRKTNQFKASKGKQFTNKTVAWKNQLKYGEIATAFKCVLAYKNQETGDILFWCCLLNPEDSWPPENFP